MANQAQPPGYPPLGQPPPGYAPHGGPPPGYPPGMRPRQGGMPGWGIALIVAGILLFVIGGLAAVAIPAFMKYMKRAKTTEAPVNLKKIFDGGKAYFEKGALRYDGTDGTDAKHQFPDSVGLTPVKSCCAQPGKKCRDSDWSSPTWKEIGFVILDPHYFRYRFSSRGSGSEAQFTAGAHADLDCDGIFSTWERTGTVDSQRRVVGAATIFQHLPLE
jgi:type IV pilus assembly protein PilA